MLLFNRRSVRGGTCNQVTCGCRDTLSPKRPTPTWGRGTPFLDRTPLRAGQGRTTEHRDPLSYLRGKRAPRRVRTGSSGNPPSWEQSRGEPPSHPVPCPRSRLRWCRGRDASSPCPLGSQMHLYAFVRAAEVRGKAGAERRAAGASGPAHQTPAAPSSPPSSAHGPRGGGRGGRDRDRAGSRRGRGGAGGGAGGAGKPRGCRSPVLPPPATAPAAVLDFTARCREITSANTALGRAGPNPNPKTPAGDAARRCPPGSRWGPGLEGAGWVKTRGLGR